MLWESFRCSLLISRTCLGPASDVLSTCRNAGLHDLERCGIRKNTNRGYYFAKARSILWSYLVKHSCPCSRRCLWKCMCVYFGCCGVHGFECCLEVFTNLAWLKRVRQLPKTNSLSYLSILNSGSHCYKVWQRKSKWFIFRLRLISRGVVHHNISLASDCIPTPLYYGTSHLSTAIKKSHTLYRIQYRYNSPKRRKAHVSALVWI